MRLREGLSILAMAGVIAACSGSGPGATNDGNGDGNGGTSVPQQATDQAQPTSNDGGPGNNGNADFTYGRVTFEVTGAIQATGEYGFIPAASFFGGPAGASLNFTDNLDENTSLFTIVQSQDGTVLVNFTGPGGTIPAATCETSNWNIGATSGSGSFNCTAEFSMMPSGAVVQGGQITGSFDAHA